MKSSKRSVNSIVINIRPSRRLASLVFMVYSTAVTSSLLLAVFFNACFYILPVFLVGHFAWVLIRQVLMAHPSSVVTVNRGSDGGWALVRANKAETTGFLRAHSFVSRYITVLIFSEPWRWITTPVVIMPDSIGEETYRQLLVLLRTTSMTGEGGI